MNQFKTLFREKPDNILSVYFTAGYPQKEDTAVLIRALIHSGADMIEIGIPFSDPMADGPVIQQSNSCALQKGMSVEHLFDQISTIEIESDTPILLMSYFNPISQYGFEKFCSKAAEAGISGFIIPDLPPEVFINEGYREITKRYDLQMIFLITPETAEERIRFIDRISDSFIYLVTSSITTGSDNSFSAKQRQYFEYITSLKLNNPILAGFGIKKKEDLDFIGKYFNGAIIGSAFIESLSRAEGDIPATVSQFIKSMRS